VTIMVKRSSAIAILIGTVLFLTQQSFQGQNAHARLAPSAPPLSSPNIVLILTDDQTVESVSKMPYLSSRTDWIRFTNAFDNVSLCCPARASLLTGQYDTHTGVLNNSGAHSGAALAEGTALPVWLQTAGYTSALVGKYLNGYPFGRALYTPPGWSEWDTFVGAADYYNYVLNRNGTTESRGRASTDYSTDVFTGIADNFLATAAPPFFLHYSPHTPHSPYTPSPSHLADLSTAAVAHDPSFNEADVSDKPPFIQALPLQSASAMDDQRRRSWAMNLSVDDAVKTFDATLAARGLLDNTVEIFMTDNGYAFGEHRWQHKRCEYDVCMRIPLMIRVPGHSGRDVAQLVTTPDIAPTIAALTGAVPQVPQDGVSLLPLIDGTATSWRDAVLEHWGGGGPVGQGNPPNFCAVRTDRYRYVRLKSGVTELYDETADPSELQNQAHNPAYSTVASDLAGRLDAYKAAGDCNEASATGLGAAYVEEP